MHGLVNRSVEEFLRDTSGPDVWAAVAQSCGVDPRGFQTVRDYPDALTTAMVAEAAGRLDQPEAEFLEDLGAWLAQRESLRRLLRFGGATYAEFVRSLDQLAERAEMVVPNLSLPQVRVTVAQGASKFTLTVERGDNWDRLLAGILRQMADDYGALALIACNDGVVSIEVPEHGYAAGREFMLSPPGGADGMSGITISVETLAALMPMHLLVEAAGDVRSVGPTLRKMIGDVDQFTQAFVPARVDSAADDVRVFLRLIDHPATVLRGVRTTLPDGSVLYDLGFGIGLPDAVDAFDLTEGDFSPAGLAMELLFLHEANAAMTAELSRSNLRLEEARAQAESQAFTDPLTGLYNRRGLEIATDLAMRNVGEGSDKAQGFALLHIDLDHFKELNDQHGHAMGDEMLVEVARKLREATRSDDTIARMGGDEFVVLLPGLTDAERLRRLGLRIIESIEAPVSMADVWCRVSASIGATMATDYDLPDPVTMMADADRALYAAKKAGRGCIRLAHEPAPDPSRLSDQPFVPHQV